MKANWLRAMLIGSLHSEIVLDTSGSLSFKVDPLTSQGRQCDITAVMSGRKGKIIHLWLPKFNKQECVVLEPQRVT